MTHVDENFLRIPASVSLKPEETGEAPGHDISLLVRGQGTIGFAVARLEPFSVTVKADLWGAPAFRWHIDYDGAVLSERVAGRWEEVERRPLPDAALDPEPECPYWFSIDFHNRALLYGKGEMRLKTMLMHHPLGAKPLGEPDPYAWLGQADAVEVTAPIRGIVDVWRDPVTSEPPLKVVSHDEITMDDIARGELTVPANLTPTCQILYDNVAGKAFVLDTPEFPDFSKAIKASIEDENGWCYKVLKEKADEFGSPDPLKTYLRITLGQNQGDSPGVPFVMEIWPAGHYSPIHNHGGSDAVIRVLHGAIWVSMYPMLSRFHEEAFAEEKFKEGDVTWISARLNQVHMLKNNDPVEPCITIQCYMYAENNRTHWPYFDYIEKATIGHFDPNSDAEFTEFRDIMREEWGKRQHAGAELTT